MINIAIEGVIGVGKTTLATALARAMGAVTLFEEDISNPFLNDFYRQRKKMALACQLTFLEGRIAQFEISRPSGLSVIADHSVSKDKMFAALNLADAEWDLYMRYYRRLAPKSGFKPDVTIYCKADLKEVSKRIKERGRQFENDIELSYLDALIHAYDNRFAKIDDHPIIVVSTNTYNISQDHDGIQRLIEACNNAPKGMSYCNPMG